MSDEEGIDQREERRIRAGQTFRVIAVVLAIVVLVWFALVNLQDVEIDYVFGEAEAPMIIVIAVSAAIGLVLGLAAGRRRRR